MLRCPQVHQAVAGAAIESRCRPAWREIGQVGDAADVEDDAVRAGSPKERVVKGGHQWGTLAPGGDVAAAEIGDNGDARPLRKQCRVVELQRVAGFGGMAHRLPMTADGAYRGRGQAGLGEQCVYGLRIRFGEAVGQQGRPMQFVMSDVLQRQRLGAHCRVKGSIVGGPAFDLVIVEAGENGIDAVQAGAGHQPDIQLGGH